MINYHKSLITIHRPTQSLKKTSWSFTPIAIPENLAPLSTINWQKKNVKNQLTILFLNCCDLVG